MEIPYQLMIYKKKSVMKLFLVNSYKITNLGENLLYEVCENPEKLLKDTVWFFFTEECKKKYDLFKEVHGKKTVLDIFKETVIEPHASMKGVFFIDNSFVEMKENSIFQKIEKVHVIRDK